MKSWISFLIPEDEYKEKKMLYFLSEGAILLVLYMVIMLIINKFADLNIGVILLAGIAVFLLYIWGRYILSGMAYTDIVTKKEYTKALRTLISRSTTVVILFAIFYLVLTITIPTFNGSWYEFLAIVISGGAVSFLFDYTSLKRSYKKNKELL